MCSEFPRLVPQALGWGFWAVGCVFQSLGWSRLETRAVESKSLKLNCHRPALMAMSAISQLSMQSSISLLAFGVTLQCGLVLAK